MNWADLVALVLIVGFALLEVKRGFAAGLVTLVGAFIAANLALIWYYRLAGTVRLAASPALNQGLVMYLLFVLLMVVVLVVSHISHPDTYLSLEPFDNFLGGLCGIGTGWIFAYVFLSGLPFLGADRAVQTSALAPEILSFRTYHRIMSGIRHLGEMKDSRGAD